MTGAGRYSPRKIAGEIEETRERLDVSVKQAAAIIGVIRTVYYKKRDLDGSSFSVLDISRLAAAWSAPEGWPLLSWREAEEFAAWKKYRLHGTPPTTDHTKPAKK